MQSNSENWQERLGCNSKARAHLFDLQAELRADVQIMLK